MAKLREDLRLEEVELLQEAQAKGRLGAIAGTYLGARGLPVDPTSRKRERDRLEKLLKRATQQRAKTRKNREKTPTPCRMELPAASGRSASEAHTLEDMTPPSTQPRYRKTTTTEVVEHFIDPNHPALDGFDEDLDHDDDDDDFDEEP